MPKMSCLGGFKVPILLVYVGFKMPKILGLLSLHVRINLIRDGGKVL